MGVISRCARALVDTHRGVYPFWSCAFTDVPAATKACTVDRSPSPAAIHIFRRSESSIKASPAVTLIHEFEFEARETAHKYGYRTATLKQLASKRLSGVRRPSESHRSPSRTTVAVHNSFWILCSSVSLTPSAASHKVM